MIEAEAAEAVDTALLKALLYTHDDYIITFIQNDNRCHIEDTIEFLSQLKVYS